MIFTETKLKGAFVIELDRRKDERGYSARSFCQKEFATHGLNSAWVQGHTSFSPKRGTLRGMHFQKAPFQEDKFIRCVRGAIYDVIIDLRKDSPTYCQWVGVELTEDNYKMIYVPKDFAHGGITLWNDAGVLYLMTQFQHPESASGVRYNDPAFGIQWPKDVEIKLMSENDKQWPDFNR